MYTLATLYYSTAVRCVALVVVCALVWGWLT